MNTKLLFICREGFGYAGWQRVEVWLVGFTARSGGLEHLSFETSEEKFRFNISHTIANRFDSNLGSGTGTSIPDNEGRLLKGDDCLFVESGESFKLFDFADAIATELEMEYTTQDGEE